MFVVFGVEVDELEIKNMYSGLVVVFVVWMRWFVVLIGCTRGPGMVRVGGEEDSKQIQLGVWDSLHELDIDLHRTSTTELDHWSPLHH